MKVSYFKICAQKLEDAFDGFRIAQVSDLHNRNFKGALLEKLAYEKPDIIVITGDMIDRDKQTQAALIFAEGAVKLAPVYYVNGNHESVLSVYPAFKNELQGMGVHVLENASVEYERKGKKLAILGMSDPRFFAGGKPEFKQELIRQTQKLSADDFVILLSHRPELFDDYVACGANVIFSGHAHGGQVRLPFVGALYAPNQGLFPKLTDGVHKKNDSIMIISKGMGRSSFMPRIFNPPELIIATLDSTCNF